MRHVLKLWLVPLACLALGLGAVACGDDDDGDGNGGTGGTAGTGGTGGTGGTAQQVIDVSGTVLPHPLFQDLGQDAPSTEGLTVRLVDAGRAISDPASAVLAQTEVGSDGSFSLENVDIGDAQVGIVLTVAAGDDRDDVVTSSLGLCQIGDDVHPSLVCRDDDNVAAFFVPTALADAIANGVGNENLVADGFVLGMTIDNAGNRLRDVTVTSNVGEVAALNPDFSTTGNNTTTDLGTFIVTGTPGSIVNITPSQTGTTFVPPSQPVGIVRDVVFQVFFRGSDEGGTGGTGGTGGMGGTGGDGGTGGGGAGGDDGA